MTPEDRVMLALLDADPAGVDGPGTPTRAEQDAALGRVRRRLEDVIVTDGGRPPRARTWSGLRRGRRGRGQRDGSRRQRGRRDGSRRQRGHGSRVPPSGALVVSVVVVAVSLSIGAVALLVHGARPPGSSADSAVTGGSATGGATTSRTATANQPTTASVTANSGTVLKNSAVGGAPTTGSATANASTSGSSLASLRAQAKLLYTPAAAFERSLTPRLRARSTVAGEADLKRVQRCQRPYQARLKSGFVAGSSARNNARNELLSLNGDGANLELLQSRIAPIAPQISTLAAAWSKLQLSDPTMNDFVHAMARQLNSDLTTPNFDSCAFVRAIAAHDYSYEWARTSSYGRADRRFWKTWNAAGRGTRAFWGMFIKRKRSDPQPLGFRLFTPAEVKVLANMPGATIG